MDWTQEAIVRLRDMWDQGLSTAEIGRRMGVSKNAITGKAHRLNLSTRPSPIRRDPAEPRVAKKAQEMPRIKEIRAEALNERRLLGAAAVVVKLDAEPPKGAAAALTGTQPATTTQRVIKCCWPSGDPGTPEF